MDAEMGTCWMNLRTAAAELCAVLRAVRWITWRDPSFPLTALFLGEPTERQKELLDEYLDHSGKETERWSG